MFFFGGNDMRNPFIAGNWKMYKNKTEALAFANELKANYVESDVRVAICAPYTQLDSLVEAFKDTNTRPNTDISPDAGTRIFSFESLNNGVNDSPKFSDIATD